MRALKVIFVTLGFLCSFFGLLGLADGQGLSKKARKLALSTNLDDDFPNEIIEEQSTSTTTITTEDPLAAAQEIDTSTTTKDPFAFFDDDPFFNNNDVLPECTEFTMVSLYLFLSELRIFLLKNQSLRLGQNLFRSNYLPILFILKVLFRETFFPVCIDTDYLCYDHFTTCNVM